MTGDSFLGLSPVPDIEEGEAQSLCIKWGFYLSYFVRIKMNIETVAVHTQHALEQVSCAELLYRLPFNTVFHIYL